MTVFVIPVPQSGNEGLVKGKEQRTFVRRSCPILEFL